MLKPESKSIDKRGIMHTVRMNYFLHKETSDIYKGIKVDQLVTGYVKYKKVEYRTERKNKDGYYLHYYYPFDGYNKWPSNDSEYFEPFDLFLPKFSSNELIEISQRDTLKDRWDDSASQMCLIRSMFDVFDKDIADFSRDKMGLDASLQCYLETPSSDIDLVVNDANLYRELYDLISAHEAFDMFSANVVDRRGAYSSFTSTSELINFENRKISYLYEGVKVSILFTDEIDLPEYLNYTGSLVFVKAKPGINKSVGEPSLVELKDIEVIYGPKLDPKKKINYLSFLPVRTGFILNEDDTLLITGMAYIGRTTGEVYISQFTWDYCRIFSAHNIALNTYFQLDDTDKRLVAHFFENLKL